MALGHAKEREHLDMALGHAKEREHIDDGCNKKLRLHVKVESLMQAPVMGFHLLVARSQRLRQMDMATT